MGTRTKRKISEEELSRWRLIEEFEQRLERAATAGKEPRTFSDPRRKLGQKDYLSLLLFGLFNPVVDSMRGLCGASELGRVQQEICSHRVSLGSFSEAQAVVEPALLQKVFGELAGEQIDGRWRLRKSVLDVWLDAEVSPEELEKLTSKMSRLSEEQARQALEQAQEQP